MTSKNQTTPDSDVQLIERFTDADDARFKGTSDWFERSLQGLDRDAADKLTNMLRCVEQLAFVGNKASTEDTLSDVSPISEASLGDYGGYEIQEVVGRGGFGIVYKAWNDRLKRNVALKIPLPHVIADDLARRRFQLEARAAASLQHPNIVTVHKVIDNQQPAIAYEFCEGGTLYEFLRQNKQLPERTIIEVATGIAGALTHAHARGVLHRDLKPGNILLTKVDQQEGHANGFFFNGDWFVPKLTDFGLAKILDENSDLTQTDVIVGSVNYMAPEQVSGQFGQTGTFTDVFSFGAVLYWLLTGRSPFQTDSRIATLNHVQHHDPEPVRTHRADISSDLESICVKCLQKNTGGTIRICIHVTG